METQKKRINFRGIAFPVIAALLLTIVVSFISIQNIQQSQYKERVSSANVLMEKITQNVSTAVSFQWSKVHSVKRVLQEQSYDSSKSLTKFLENMDRTTDDEYWLIDSTGWTLMGDGSSFLWRNQSQLLSEKDSFVAGDYQSDSDSTMRDYYITRFEKPILIDDKTYTHLILVGSMKDLDPFFEVSNYGENSITFIIRDNGVQMYRQERKNQLSGVYNVLSALEQANFKEGSSLEEMQKDIRNRVDNTICLTYDGITYYVSYAHLGIDNLTALLFVPEKNITGRTSNFTFSIVRNVSLIFLCTLLLVVMAILLSTRRTRQAQQQAIEAERSANKAKTDFLSSMSHDIRTPMNAIVGMADMAVKKGDDPAVVQNCIEKIQQASHHLLTLVNDVLDISKIESREMMLSEEDFSLAGMIEDLTTIIQSQVDERKQHFNLEMHDIMYDILYGDEMRLNQIYINILSNAVKYTDEGGRIHVEFYEEATANADTILLHYVVSDNGIGMSEEFQKKMYDTFARGIDSRVNKVSGTGLGLAIVKQMVDLIGGTIVCESALGEGTTFHITLPIQIGHQPDDISEIDEKMDNSNLTKLHLLVAEDNDLNWELMSEYLAMYGVQADRAENGRICVDKMESAQPGQYAAILMDIRMPVMNGYEATRLIRKSDKAWIRKIPIIAVTADAFAEDVQACIEAGMNDHVSRPVDFDKLLDKISEYTKISGGGKTTKEDYFPSSLEKGVNR